MFGSALDWPGWCRQGRTQEEALADLRSFAPRFEIVARRAGLDLAPGLEFEVVEALAGNMTTDFGAPGAIAKADGETIDGAAGRRLAALMGAIWTVLDETAHTAPAELRKGPRGGGRDTAEVVEHVLAAEDAYLRKVGIKIKDPQERRDALLTLLNAGRDPGAAWPLRYAVRRTAWHALDHAWEIEDRSQ